MKIFAALILAFSISAAAQTTTAYSNVWTGIPLYPTGQTVTYCPTTACSSGTLYAAMPYGLISITQNVAGSGMTVGGPYTITCTGGGTPSAQASATFSALTATTISTPLITSFGGGTIGYTSSPTCTSAATGGTPPTFTVTMTNVNLNKSPATYAGTYWQPLFNAIPFPGGTPSFTPATNVTSVACATGYTCTNARGTVTVTVSGTAVAASANVFTMSFGNYNGSDLITLPVAPGGVQLANSGGAAAVLFHGAPTTLGITTTTPSVITASTVFNVDYNFIP